MALTVSNSEGRTYRRMLNYEGDGDSAVLHTLSMGRTVERPMTEHERLIVGIYSTEPTSALTLSSQNMSHAEANRSRQNLLKAVRRRVNRPDRPLIYCATVACSEGHGGYHLHMLLWEYLPQGIVAGIARLLGFGPPYFRNLSGLDDLNRFTATAYCLRQMTPAFDSKTHQDHRPRPKHAKEILYPANKTLAAEKPELLSAIRDAKSKHVSDIELISRVPFFNSYRQETKDRYLAGVNGAPLILSGPSSGG